MRIADLLISGSFTDKKYFCFMANEIEKQLATQPNLLDLDIVLADKSPMLKKLLPGFAMRYLKRIIHQDELNFYLTE